MSVYARPEYRGKGARKRRREARMWDAYERQQAAVADGRGRLDPEQMFPANRALRTPNGDEGRG